MNTIAKKTVIVVAGPTGVGKTATAIRLAKYFNTETISADSRQCFKEMNIGVARPSVEELQEVPHYFIASHSIRENVNAVVFEKYALQKAAELFQLHNVVIMAGGTGLYIKAFCEGMDDIPVVDPIIRSSITAQYEAKGITWLQEEIRQKDPDFYKEGEIKNPQRMMRALEVILSTGQSIVCFQQGKKARRDFDIIKIGLELPREELRQHIDLRTEKMMDTGLVEEVKSLLPYRYLNALQTVGYSEVFDFLDDKISLQEATEVIKIHTRQYAKRQMTWFKKDKSFQWFRPDQQELLIDFLTKKLLYR